MKIAKTIAGGIDAVLILIYLIFSFSGRMIIAATALGVLTITFSAIALVGILASSTLEFVNNKNDKTKKIVKIGGIVGGVASVASGGVGLAYAITVSANASSPYSDYHEIVNTNLSVTNISIAGTIILFSLIFVALACASLASANKGPSVALQNGQIKDKEAPAKLEIHELDLSKEVARTVQISANSNIGVGLWTSICIALCGIFGTKSLNYAKKMDRVTEDALKQLILQSYYMDADTVIDIHYALYGLTVIAYGTAVFYKK